MAQDFSFIPTSQLHPQWQQILAPRQQQAAPKPKYGGLAGALINNLPSIAGGIGLVGGEILDPFGGGLLTGSLASGAGEALKQKLLGQSLSPKQIAIQAGETAALGGIGKGFGAARAGSKALLGAPSAEETAASAVKPTFRQAMATQGEQMQARGLGISGGAHVAGVPDLFPQDTNRMLATLKAEKIPLGNANTAANAVQNKLTQYGDNIDNILKTSNVSLDTKAKQAVVDRFKTAIENLPGVDDSVRKQANNLASNYTKQVSDAIGQNKFIRGLDQHVISYIANPEAGSAAKQLAAKTFRGILRDNTNELVPGLKEANNSYHALTEIKPFLGKGMREVNQPSGGLIGRIASSGPVQKMEATIGRGIEKAGTIGGNEALPSDVGQTASGIKGNLVGRTIAPFLAKPGATTGAIIKQAAGRGLANALLVGSPQQQPTDLAGAISSIDNSGGMSGASPTDQPAITPEAYQEAVMGDLQRTGGKNLATLKNLYDQFGPQKPTSLDATQQKEVSASIAAIGRIQQYGQQLDQLTKGANGNVASGTLSTILGKYDPLANASQKQAAALQSSRRDVAIQLATALMGGNKPSAQSVDEIEASLPSVNDSPELRQNKLNAILSGLHENLRNYATPVSQITQSLGYGPTSNGDVGSQLSGVLAGLSQ